MYIFCTFELYEINMFIPTGNKTIIFLHVFYLYFDQDIYPVRGTVSCRYIKVQVHPKLLTYQSKFSGPRKFTLRCQQFKMTGTEK